MFEKSVTNFLLESKDYIESDGLFFKKINKLNLPKTALGRIKKWGESFFHYYFFGSNVSHIIDLPGFNNRDGCRVFNPKDADLLIIADNITSLNRDYILDIYDRMPGPKRVALILDSTYLQGDIGHILISLKDILLDFPVDIIIPIEMLFVSNENLFKRIR